MIYLLFLAVTALVADHIDLYAVAYNSAGDAAAQALHQPLNGSGAELAYIAAPDAYRVMMMPNARETVPGGSIDEV